MPCRMGHCAARRGPAGCTHLSTLSRLEATTWRSHTSLPTGCKVHLRCAPTDTGQHNGHLAARLTPVTHRRAGVRPSCHGHAPPARPKAAPRPHRGGARLCAWRTEGGWRQPMATSMSKCAALQQPRVALQQPRVCAATACARCRAAPQGEVRLGARGGVQGAHLRARRRASVDRRTPPVAIGGAGAARRPPEPF
jgi:hypothetical protein